MSAGTDPSRVDVERPMHDPQTGPSRLEFFRGINRLEREVRGEADGLRLTAGWMAISLAFWLFMIGYVLLNKMERGRPRP